MHAVAEALRGTIGAALPLHAGCPHVILILPHANQIFMIKGTQASTILWVSQEELFKWTIIEKDVKGTALYATLTTLPLLQLSGIQAVRDWPTYVQHFFLGGFSMLYVNPQGAGFRTGPHTAHGLGHPRALLAAIFLLCGDQALSQPQYLI